MSRHIRIRTDNVSDDDDTDFDFHFPLFIYALRDFSLVLEIDDKEVSADEYLEYCLKLRKEVTKQDTKYNQPRFYLRKYFKQRKCFTFDRPVSIGQHLYVTIYTPQKPPSESEPLQKVHGFGVLLCSFRSYF